MKNYIGFSRDHSGSMRGIARAAARDYNSKIASIREAASATQQDTIVSVVECGYGDTDRVRRVVTNSAVSALTPLNESAYQADGSGTPLYDSIGELIEMFQAVPDVNEKTVSFLVMAITDGHENASRKYSKESLKRKIKELNDTDRWSFVVRVPVGGKRKVVMDLGIPEDNVQEWDTTSNRGVEVAAARDAEAFTSYFTARSTGATKTTKFYTDLSKVSSADVAAVLTDVSSEVNIWPVGPKDHDAEIRPFIEARLGGKPMLKGAGFYQLTKTEPTVQDHKKILVRDKTTAAIYFGQAARQMLGLPSYGNIRLAPGNHGNFDIFIQSTSVNRKLQSGTSLVYWPNVGIRYKEGPSAR
jgi:hypothetical protein